MSHVEPGLQTGIPSRGRMNGLERVLKVRFRSLFALVAITAFSTSGQGLGQEVRPFGELVGNVEVQPVSTATPLELPFLTWGGDVATFHANGGLTTRPDTIYGKLGLDFKLTAGDNFVGQVRNYLSGKTPFLRGTFRMLGMASEVLGRDPRTKPVVIAQLSWSAGDHIVGRSHLRSLNDLLPKNGRKVRIACQQGGPHVGLLFDSLQAAQIARDQIEIVWVSDLTGPNGAAEKFRQDPSIDACCVITPDMTGLTGGIKSVGTGAEGTIEGARVVNSTQDMSRSIADVYAVRADWFQAHRDVVEKMVSGYLKSSEEMVAYRDEFQKTGTLQPAYQEILLLSQQIFGETVLPSLEVDAHGLLLDCSFVGLPGQIAFFEDRGNLNGFARKLSSSLDLATGWGYATERFGFDPPGFDYQELAKLSGVKYERPTEQQGRFSGEATDVLDGATPLDERTIVSFTIHFQVNEDEFSADQYGAEFSRALQSASTFGNALVLIRGHADPTATLKEFINAGIEKGLIKRTGTSTDARYYFNGKKLDLQESEGIIKLIRSGAFEGKHRPNQVVQAALNLSQRRAEAVKKSLVAHAKRLGVNLDESQIQPVGVGVTEPIVPVPRTHDEAAENRRVEFRVVRVQAEALNDSDFDF